jgi:hypothetical protein
MTQPNAYTGFWTGHEQKAAYVAEQWVGGASAGYIARALGTTRGTVMGKVRRMGLSGRQTSPGLQLRAPRQPRKPKVPRPPVKARVQRTPLPVPTEGLVRFIDHKGSFQCIAPMWPNDQAWKPDAVYSVMVCGRPVEDGKSYCAAHCAAFYLPEKKRERGGFVLFPRAA